MKGFTLGLALKQRQNATRKWPIAVFTRWDWLQGLAARLCPGDKSLGIHTKRIVAATVAFALCLVYLHLTCTTNRTLDGISTI